MPGCNYKTIDIKFSAHDAFLVKTFSYARCQKIGKHNNFKVFRGLKTKGPQQISQQQQNKLHQKRLNIIPGSIDK